MVSESASGSASPRSAGGATSTSECPVSEETRSAFFPSLFGSARPPSSSSGDKLPASLEESASHPHTPQPNQTFPLSPTREISNIPRGRTEDTAVDAPHQSSTLTSTDRWVYPSQQQYYNAIKKKGWKGVPEDSIPFVLHVHNNVNERSWQGVLDWERRHEADLSSTSSSLPTPAISSPSEASGGKSAKEYPYLLYSTQNRSVVPTYSPPRLVRFLGRPTSPSPKSIFMRLTGYLPPFDRHDWVVERCRPPTAFEKLKGVDGIVREEVRYVIDFYTGKGGLTNDAVPVFLDVRPAVDSGNNLKERILDAFGMWRR